MGEGEVLGVEEHPRHRERGAHAVVAGTVPAARLTEGMAIMHTGVVAGVAPGATVAGIVIDNAGASPAYAVAAAAGAVAALAALTLPRHRPEPSAPEVPTTTLHP